MKSLKQHDRIFFSRGDFLNYANSGCQDSSCAQAVEDLQTSNYFVSLPPHADWKLIGWDRKLSSEEKKQSYTNSK